MRLPLLTTILATAVLAAPAAAMAADDLMIDTATNSPGGYSTRPLSNRDFNYGTGPVQSYRAVGQIVTAPEGAAAIKRVDFDTWGWNEPSLRAEVWTWDGMKPVNQLYVGHGQKVIDHEIKSWTFAPVPVVAGQQYLLVLSAFDATDPQTGYGRGSWVGVGDNGPWDDRYTGGEFVLFPGTSRADFTTTAWESFPDSADYDLAFRAVFAMGGTPPVEPEPEQPQTPPAGGGGGGGGGVTVPPVSTEVPSTDPPAPAPVDAPIPGPVGSAITTPVSDSGTERASGPTRCVVPDLKGKTVGNARRALTRAGCRMGHIDGRGNRVLRQSRPGGRSVPRGSAVSIVVRF